MIDAVDILLTSIEYKELIEHHIQRNDLLKLGVALREQYLEEHRMNRQKQYLAEHDLNSDQTQTFIYACLAGVAVNGLVKQAGIKFSVKFANSVIKKIPGKVLTKINQKVGFRLVTKFGSKGIVNLGKMLPGVGAIVGGGLDFVETKVIAERAYNWFMMGDFSVKDEGGNDIMDINNDDYTVAESTDR